MRKYKNIASKLLFILFVLFFTINTKNTIAQESGKGDKAIISKSSKKKRGVFNGKHSNYKEQKKSYKKTLKDKKQKAKDPHYRSKTHVRKRSKDSIAFENKNEEALKKIIKEEKEKKKARRKKIKYNRKQSH